MLTIIHSNDLHSRFDAWARMETVAKRIRAEVGADAVLRLDAGDHGDRAFPLTEGTRGEASVALLGAAGVDAFTCGNNECLAWPADHQSALAASAPYPMLAADLRLVDGRPVPGFTDRIILNRCGIKVGIFGLTPDLQELLTPLGLDRRPAVDVATENVRELRTAGCDLVILLSHMGYNSDKRMAAAVPGIDVIVGGHSHVVLPRGEQVAQTVIVQAGEYGRYVGRLDLTVTEGRVTAWTACLLETEGEQPDAATQALIADWEAKSQARLGEVVAHLLLPLPHDPLGESPLADLLARRLEAKYGAEIALVHGGVLLAGLPSGPVTLGDLLRICPCNLNPTLAEIRGEKLIDLLALPDAACNQKIARNGMRGDTVIGRIFGVGLAAIEADRLYRVACNDYLAFGFEPFTMLDGCFEGARVAADHRLRDTLREALTGMALRPGDPVRVEAWSLDGHIKKRMEAHVLHAGADLVKLRAEAGHNICAEDGRVLWTAQIAVEYYFWPGREYNLFRFYSADGSWAGDYYNLATPIAARDGVIAYADLELDVYLPSGEPARLLDEDELDAAPYPPELKVRIRRIGEWLLTVAGTDDAPGGRPPVIPIHQKSGV
jgi:5'-nucleotidase